MRVVSTPWRLLPACALCLVFGANFGCSGGGAAGTPGAGADGGVGTGAVDAGADGGSLLDASGEAASGIFYEGGPLEAAAGEAGMPLDGGSDAPTTVACTFSVTSSTSTKIPTVGIVTWSTTLPGVTEAHIDFGLTSSYGMTAPVDLTAVGYRTLLLGMKAQNTYHFRVEASGPSGQCTGPDETIATGALASGLPTIAVTPTSATGLYGGFLLTGQYVQNGSGPAYVLDADGDVVWWYSVSGSDATGVVMSYDGRSMWINGANVPKAPNKFAHVHRVSMDGLTDDDFSTAFAGQNHQVTVLPNETVGFYAYGTNGCDDIKEYVPSTGTATLVVNSSTASMQSSPCHCNAIQYSSSDDTLVFSDLDHNDYVKVTQTGTTVWILNGTTSSFKGDSWTGGQHGFHILSATDILLFNNNTSMPVAGDGTGGGTGKGSIAFEMLLDTTAMTAMRSWSYTANPGIQVDIMGDLQRLPNGNTIVAYSTKGQLEEVDATANLLQKWTWPANTAFGYIQKRATLYGPPPR